MKLTQTPKPERISQWGSATEIIYKCRNCGCSFSFYGNQEIFCHHCGYENDWTNVPSHMSEKYAKEYHNANYQTQRKIIKALDKTVNKR